MSSKNASDAPKESTKPNTPQEILDQFWAKVEREGWHIYSSKESLEALHAATIAALPESINWHDAIGDIVGHNDPELDSFDKGYNKCLDYVRKAVDELYGVKS